MPSPRKVLVPPRVLQDAQKLAKAHPVKAHVKAKVVAALQKLHPMD